jgi:hypothetical protein
MKGYIYSLFSGELRKDFAADYDSQYNLKSLSYLKNVPQITISFTAYQNLMTHCA